jgi:hypothetical protein
MAQHVRVHFERHLGLDPDALDHLLQAGHGEGRSPLADEDEGRLGVPLNTDSCQRQHRGGAVLASLFAIAEDVIK